MVSKLHLIGLGIKHINNSNISINLLMCLTESIGNSIRHGNATNIFVKIRIKPSSLSMKIIDNGIGFDQKFIKSEGGLRNMKRRISSIGGDFSIHSILNNGTEILFTTPF